MKNTKFEFYENKYFLIFRCLFLILMLFIFIILFLINSDFVERKFVILTCLLMLIGIIFSFKMWRAKNVSPYIVLDSSQITFKDREFDRLTMGFLVQKHTLHWNEIKSISYTLYYKKMASLKLYSSNAALRLDLKNGEKKWIMLYTLSDNTCRLLLDAIQCYKPLNFERKYNGNDIKSLWWITIILMGSFFLLSITISLTG